MFENGIDVAMKARYENRTYNYVASTTEYEA